MLLLFVIIIYYILTQVPISLHYMKMTRPLNVSFYFYFQSFSGAYILKILIIFCSHSYRKSTFLDSQSHFWKEAKLTPSKADE